MKKVLVIEDDRTVILKIQRWLREVAILVVAASLAEVDDVFGRHDPETFDLILMDGTIEESPGLKGERLNTLSVVTRLSSVSVQGVVVAISAHPGSQERLLAAGCHSACLKEHLTREALLAFLNPP